MTLGKELNQYLFYGKDSILPKKVGATDSSSEKTGEKSTKKNQQW